MQNGPAKTRVKSKIRIPANKDTMRGGGMPIGGNKRLPIGIGHLLERFGDFAQATRFFGVIALDQCQVIGKQLGRNNSDNR